MAIAGRFIHTVMPVRYKHAAQKVAYSALERNLHNACNMTKTPQDACDLLKKVHEITSIKSPIIPERGILKPIKLDGAHLLMAEQNFDKMHGFHFDVKGKIENSGNVKYLLRRDESNGVSRALFELNGKIKESSFFPNQSYDHVSLTKKIIDNLAQVDYTKLKVNKAGKFDVEICFDGIYVKAFINSSTFKADCYPIHPDWKQNALYKEHFGIK